MFRNYFIWITSAMLSVSVMAESFDHDSLPQLSYPLEQSDPRVLYAQATGLPIAITQFFTHESSVPGYWEIHLEFEVLEIQANSGLFVAFEFTRDDGSVIEAGNLSSVQVMPANITWEEAMNEDLANNYTVPPHVVFGPVNAGDLVLAAMVSSPIYQLDEIPSGVRVRSMAALTEGMTSGEELTFGDRDVSDYYLVSPQLPEKYQGFDLVKTRQSVTAAPMGEVL